MANAQPLTQKNNLSLRHLAIIMDGNGRWAERRRLPRVAGHKQGVDAARAIVEVCARAGLEALTLFAFSSENWSRPKQEVSFLMDLFLSTLREQVDELADNGLRLRFIGDRQAFSPSLRTEMAKAETNTADNHGLCLNLALNYGGRWDCAQAARQLVQRAVLGELRPQDIDTAEFARYLSLAELPDPDLMIRTGGEHRVSNFLLWQLAYTELYFSEQLWPDFTPQELHAAFAAYQARERRFGATSAQLVS